MKTVSIAITVFIFLFLLLGVILLSLEAKAPSVIWFIALISVILFFILGTKTKFFENNIGSKKKENKEKPTKKSLSPGAQVGLTGLFIGVFIVLAFRHNFAGIFTKETPLWLKWATIFIIARSIWFFVANLGQKLTFTPIRSVLNLLWFIAFLVVIPALILGWKGENPFNRKSKGDGSEVRISDPPQIICSDTLEVGRRWINLEEIPDYGEKFVFEVPDTTTTLLWQYEGGYGRIKVPLYKRGAKQIGGLVVDGPNDTRARAQIRTKRGNKVKIVLTVQ